MAPHNALFTVTAALLLVACGAQTTITSTTASFAGASRYSTIAFAPITTNPPVASNGASLSNLPVSSMQATINGNTVATFSGYSVLMRTGYTDTNGNILGLLIDMNGNPLYNVNDTSSFTQRAGNYQCGGDTAAATCASAAPFYQSSGNYQIVSTTTYQTLSACANVVGCSTAVASSLLDISPQPDHTSLLAVGGNLYSVIQFESPNPAVMYMVGLTLSTSNDLAVTPGTLKPINWAPYGGLVSPCAGSTTPWQSHLGSEESTGVVDARDFAAYFYQTVSYAKSISLSNFASGFMRYFGVYPAQLTNATVLANYDPYMYGFPTEVKITPGVGAGYTAVKHMAMGRAPWEMSLVMPDNRTVYNTPDATNGGFYKYIANTQGDLSAGALYCAAFTQTSPVNSVGGTFTISWILMANTSDAFVLNAVNGTANGVAATQLTFDDIFNSDLPTSATSGACNTGFTSVNAGYGSYTANSVSYPNECLKLNAATPNAAVFAATLETARYAGMLGCTTEFTKWEGITVSARRQQLYTAMSYWTASSGMSNTTTSAGAPVTLDIGGSQDINVAAATCGCVYYLQMDSTWSANTMAPLVCGTPQTADANGNLCAVTGIASPDNVNMMEDFDTLLIGEDTSTHRVDYIWQYTFPNAPGVGSPANGTLTPMFSGILGSEVTSPYWHNLGNGFGYLINVIQHPYGESDNGYATLPTSSGTPGYIGYVGPIPIPAPTPTLAAPAASAAVPVMKPTAVAFAAAVLAAIAF